MWWYLCGLVFTSATISLSTNDLFYSIIPSWTVFAMSYESSFGDRSWQTAPSMSDDRPLRRAPSICGAPAGDGGTKQLAASVDPSEQQTSCCRQIADNRGAGKPRRYSASGARRARPYAAESASFWRRRRLARLISHCLIDKRPTNEQTEQPAASIIARRCRPTSPTRGTVPPRTVRRQVGLAGGCVARCASAERWQTGSLQRSYKHTDVSTSRRSRPTSSIRFQSLPHYTRCSSSFASATPHLKAITCEPFRSGAGMSCLLRGRHASSVECSCHRRRRRQRPGRDPLRAVEIFIYQSVRSRRHASRSRVHGRRTQLTASSWSPALRKRYREHRSQFQLCATKPLHLVTSLPFLSHIVFRNIIYRGCWINALINALRN